MIRRLPRRLTAAIAGVATGLLLAIVPAIDAYAHVTVSSPDAAPGGFGKIVFRVPNESDSANTTVISVQLPTDTPLAFVSVGALPGWTANTTTAELPEPVEDDGFTLTEAVSSVTWTADGDGLPPHQFAEFQLSVGPIPDVDQLVFPATQTYSDGEVVAWADPTVEGEDEPAHPAPVLELNAADAADDDSSEGGSDSVARALGIAGVALGAAGLAIGLRARQSRRDT
ncbi:MAG TPA: YcnI family protein [Ilumatobacter sp.]|nr:YcnI family protein [Ilumatobacter sp.]